MNTDNEYWNDIPGYEGLYQCSNLGRIKALKSRKYLQPTILKNSKTANGYTVNHLERKFVKKRFLTHRLVAATFLNMKLFDDYVVDHINGIRNDNRVVNLQVVSQRENISVCFRKNKGTFKNKYIGVSFNEASKKYVARIVIDKKMVHLGSFDNEVDAANAYIEKAKTTKNYRGAEKLKQENDAIIARDKMIDFFKE